VPKGYTSAGKSVGKSSSGKKGTASGNAAKTGAPQKASSKRTGGSKNESRGAVKYPTSQGT